MVQPVGKGELKPTSDGEKGKKYLLVLLGEVLSSSEREINKMVVD